MDLSYRFIGLVLLALITTTYTENIDHESNDRNIDSTNFSLPIDQQILPTNAENDTIERTKRRLVFLMPIEEDEADDKSMEEEETHANEKTKRCNSSRRKRLHSILENERKFDPSELRAIALRNGISQNEKNSQKYYERRRTDLLGSPKNSDPSKDPSTSKSSIENDFVNDEEERAALLEALANNLKLNNYEIALLNRKPSEKPKDCEKKKYVCYCQEEECQEKPKNGLLRAPNTKQITTTRKGKPDKKINRKLYSAFTEKQKKPIYEESLATYHQPDEYIRRNFPILQAQHPAHYFPTNLLIPNATMLQQQYPHGINNFQFLPIIPRLPTAFEYLPTDHIIDNNDPTKMNIPFNLMNERTDLVGEPGITSKEYNDLSNPNNDPLIGNERQFSQTFSTPRDEITRDYTPINSDEDSSLETSTRTPLFLEPLLGKSISFEECMKLYDRDICVLAATPARRISTENALKEADDYDNCDDSTEINNEGIRQEDDRYSTQSSMIKDSTSNNFVGQTNKDYDYSTKPDSPVGDSINYYTNFGKVPTEANSFSSNNNFNIVGGTSQTQKINFKGTTASHIIFDKPQNDIDINIENKPPVITIAPGISSQTINLGTESPTINIYTKIPNDNGRLRMNTGYPLKPQIKLKNYPKKPTDLNVQMKKPKVGKAKGSSIIGIAKPNDSFDDSDIKEVTNIDITSKAYDQLLVDDHDIDFSSPDDYITGPVSTSNGLMKQGNDDLSKQMMDSHVGKSKTLDDKIEFTGITTNPDILTTEGFGEISSQTTSNTEPILSNIQNANNDTRQTQEKELEYCDSDEEVGATQKETSSPISTIASTPETTSIILQNTAPSSSTESEYCDNSYEDTDIVGDQKKSLSSTPIDPSITESILNLSTTTDHTIKNTQPTENILIKTDNILTGPEDTKNTSNSNPDILKEMNPLKVENQTQETNIDSEYCDESLEEGSTAINHPLVGKIAEETKTLPDITESDKSATGTTHHDETSTVKNSFDKVGKVPDFTEKSTALDEVASKTETMSETSMESVTSIDKEGYTTIESLTTQENVQLTKQWDEGTTQTQFSTENILTATEPNEPNGNLSHCDILMLQNLVKGVINHFAPNESTEIIGDRQTLEKEEQKLSPQIINIPNIKDILLIPEIQDTIIQRVQNVLPDLTGIPKENIVGGWASNLIKNTLNNIVDNVPQTNLPSMTVAERQYKHGTWTTHLVTLVPPDPKEKQLSPLEKLHATLKNLLYHPAVGAQADDPIVQSMLVQATKNSMQKTKTKDITEIADSMIRNVLHKVLEEISLNEDRIHKKLQPIKNDSSKKILPTTSPLESRSNLDTSKAKAGNANQSEFIGEPNQTTETTAKRIEDKPCIQKPSKKIFDDSKPTETNAANVGQALQNKNKENMEVTTNTIRLNSQGQSESTTWSFEQIIEGDILNDTTISPVTEQQSTNSQFFKPITVTIEPLLSNTHEGKPEQSTSKSQYFTERTENVDFSEKSPIKYYSPNDIILEYVKNHQSDDKTKSTPDLDCTYDDITEEPFYEESAETPVPKYDKKLIEEAKSSLRNLLINSNKNTSATYLSNDETEKALQNIVSKPIQTAEIFESHAQLTTTVAPIASEPTLQYTQVPEVSQFNPKKLDCKSLSPESIKVGQAKSVNSPDSKEIKNSETFDRANSIRGSTENCDDSSGCILQQTKNAEATDAEPETDYTYLGRLYPSNKQKENDLSSLQGSDLYYIGDGVKLPLEIKRLNDGSYALSISEKVCEQILKRKCPCCVPLEGNVMRTARSNLTANSEIQRNSKGRGNRSPKEGNRVPPKRSTRSIPSRDPAEKYLIDKKSGTVLMPVIAFAKRYNLTLDLNNEKLRKIPNKESDVYTKSNLEKDKNELDNGENGTEYKGKRNVEENANNLNRAILNDNNEDINESNDGESEENDDRKLYGYQKNNPILERIKFAKKMQKRQGQYGYQRNEDPTDTTNAMIDFLNSLKKFLLNAS